MATAIPPDLDRPTLLSLTPAKYLRGGYRDEKGAPRPELRSIFATAAATQLEVTETSPQELGATLEALRQVLPLHVGLAPERVADAGEEALLTVASMYKIDNNPGIVSFLKECAAAVQGEDDVPVLLDHVQAVVRQYAVFVALGNG
jgi:hypothetical protein